MLEVKNLYYRIGDFELKDISFSVKRGEYAVILGPSGSGKTTLFELIAGFRKPLRGNVLLNGKEITNLPPEERNISVLYQDYLLFPHLNVFENIAFGLRKKVRDPEEVEKIVSNLAEEIGIRHLLGRDIEGLSGGERQRVALARALAVRPALLLLDEPFSALDVKNREHLRKLVKRLSEEWNLTVLHITHDIADAENLADKVILINRGKIEEWGNFERVFFKPRTPFAVQFLEVNLLEGELAEMENNLAKVKVGKTYLFAENFENLPPKGGKVKLYFRPEVVRLEGENALSCEIKELYRERFFIKTLLTYEGREIKAFFPFEFEEFLLRKRRVEISIPPKYLFAVGV